MHKFIFLTLLSIAAAPLAAGTVVNMEERELPDGDVEASVMSVDGKLVAVTATDGRMIYRGDRNEMVLVNDDERSYFVLDANMAAGVASQMDAAMKQMEEALKDLPPEQQEMARRAMRQQSGQAPPPQVKLPDAAARAQAADSGEQVERTSETATREGFPCVKYEVTEAGEKIRELWVTDWSNVSGQANLATAMKSMLSYLEKLTESFSGIGGEPTISGAVAQWSGIDGMPIVTTEFDNGVATEETVVKSIENASVARSTFEIPEGYAKKSF
jgi:hypothetical protein